MLYIKNYKIHLYLTQLWPRNKKSWEMQQVVGRGNAQTTRNQQEIHEGKKYLVSINLKWEESIKIYLKDTGRKEVNLIYLAQKVAACREYDGDSYQVSDY